ncbi:MAG TPA: VIT and VWA domain-containing protein [Acetobacteraceae bacterium]|nr:VIT and VWA domain-containing protein [Acetobacteraceae bacterium]
MPRNQPSPVALYIDTIKRRYRGRSVPLIGTDIDVSIIGGVAVVTTERLFRNGERETIEATMTFPVPVHAALTSLSAEIDGRRVKGIAQPRVKARQTYETALDAGKTAVLHEELLRGIHMVSVGHVPFGKTIAVRMVWVMPLTAGDDDTAVLYIPTTVGDVYREPPLPDSDALVHGGSRQMATIRVQADGGVARLRGTRAGGEKVAIDLNAPIEIDVAGWEARSISGRAADGRAVSIEFARLDRMDNPLALDLLFDTSLSMSGIATVGPKDSKYSRAKRALAAVAAERLRADDRIRLWTFNATANFEGKFNGPGLGPGLECMRPPNGGTAMGPALNAAIAAANWPTDLLLVTDGKSNEFPGAAGTLDVQQYAAAGRRIHVLLIGEDALEANVGHIAALTGGQLFATSGGADLEIMLRNVVNAARMPASAGIWRAGQDDGVEYMIGGLRLRANWAAPGGTAAGEFPADDHARAIGAFAASLRIPHLPENRATELAVAEGLCGHLTSLVLVDEEGESQEGLPMQRKIALPSPRTHGIVDASLRFARRTSLRHPSPDGADTPSVSPYRALVRAEAAAGAPPVADAGIDWQSDPESLARGELAGQAAETTARVMAFIAFLRKLPDLSGFEESEILRAVIFALAYRASDDRNAARIMRRLSIIVQPRLLDRVREFIR